MGKIMKGIIGTIIALGIFGGTLYLTPDQLERAYVCTVNENLGFFDRLSSTGKTGYYVNELNESKSSVCRNGYWIKLKDYAEARGVSVEEILQQSTQPVPVPSGGSSGKQYLCNFQGCVVKWPN